MEETINVSMSWWGSSTENIKSNRIKTENIFL
jgi:hypothetical protein